MKLRRISLQDFHNFDQFEAEFAEGLNIVKGPNEAGKSTLNDAIMLGLFDRPTGKKTELDYQAWGEDNLYKIELTCFTDDDNEITIRKDYETTTHEIITDQGSNPSREALERATEDTTGTQSRRLFESTACIYQGSIADIDSGRREISEQLQQIVTGSGDISVDKSIEKLQQKVSEFERGWYTSAPKNPGPIKRLQVRISVLRQESDQIRGEVDRREQAREAYQVNEERRENIDSKLNVGKKVIGNYLAKEALKVQFDEVIKTEGDLEERIGKIRTADQSKREAELALESQNVFGKLDQDKYKQLRSIQEKVQANRAQLNKQQEIIKKIEGQIGEIPEKPSRNWVLQSIPIFLGISLLMVGIILLVLLSPPTSYVSGVILLGLGGTTSLAGIIWLMVVLLKKEPKFQAQLDLAKRQSETYKKDLETSQIALGESLSEFECDDWMELEEKYESYKALKSDLELAEATLDGALSSDEGLENLEEERKEVSRKRRDIEEQLEDLKDIPDLSAGDYQKTVNMIAILDEEIKNIGATNFKLQGQLEVGKWTLEDLYRTEEQLASIEGQLQNALERYKVYSISLEVMKEAREFTMLTAKDELGPKLGRYLEQLTQGKYSEVLVDDNLNPMIVHESKPNDPISPNELSKGALDQLYLAARLAICDLIFPEKCLPLFMDDPFVTFDPNRRDAALELCKDLSEDRQIILYTCHEGYDEYADRVVEL